MRHFQLPRAAVILASMLRTATGTLQQPQVRQVKVGGVDYEYSPLLFANNLEIKCETTAASPAFLDVSRALAYLGAEDLRDRRCEVLGLNDYDSSHCTRMVVRGTAQISICSTKGFCHDSVHCGLIGSMVNNLAEKCAWFDDGTQNGSGLAVWRAGGIVWVHPGLWISVHHERDG